MAEMALTGASRLERARRTLAWCVLALSVAVLVGSLLGASPAHAETFTVNSTANSGDGVCDDTECTLREAIDEANSNGEADTIGFASGLGGEIELSASSPATGGFRILDDAQAEDLVIDGPGAGVLAVDGTGQVRPFEIFPGANAAIEGLTIKDGSVAEDTGGGISNDGTLTVTNSTVSGNSSDLGGGILNDESLDTATLGNAIVAGNSARIGAPDAYGTFDSQGYNLIGDDTSSSGWVSSDLLDRDPLLGPLQDNGGPTQTHALQGGSPAIDAGPPPSECPPPAADQRGVKRPQGDGCDIGAFELQVPNRPPVAQDDSASTDEDTPIDVDVLSNDSDADPLDALAVKGLTRPRNGSAAVNPDGTVRYAPAKDFDGTDSFTYRASDGQARSEVARVSIRVRAVNDAPVARGNAYAAIEDETLTTVAPGVLANDSDPEGAKLSAKLASGPRHGKLALRANGSFAYTPDENYSGSDSFTYRVTDGKSNSNRATVKIAVRAASEPDPRGCTIEGNANDNVLRGTTRNDVICGYGGKDTIKGLGANDTIKGGGGRDTIYGGSGKDTIQGNEGNDRIYGGDGGDIMQGNDGDDKLYGQSGADLMHGGAGRDLLDGGSGEDLTHQ